MAMSDRERLYHESNDKRLSDKEYVARLPANIRERQLKAVELHKRFEEVMASFDPSKSTMEIAGVARLINYNADELARFASDFDLVIAIKEQYDHAASQAKNKLAIYNCLFEKRETKK